MKLVRLTIVVACLQAACVAHAAPRVWYDPPTGRIAMVNDSGAVLAAFGIISAGSNVRTDPSLFKTIDGATFDSGDLPLGFTYLSFPKTGLSQLGIVIGSVIQPNTPVNDLSAFFYRSLANPIREKAIINGPEPAAGTLAAVAATAFFGLARRFRR